MTDNIKFPPNETYWWIWKRYPLAFSTSFYGDGIGDEDGEWRAIGLGLYRLVLDMREWGP